MIATPYLALGGALALVVAGGFGYYKGYGSGQDHVNAQIAKQLSDNVRQLRVAEGRLGRVVFEQQTRETTRQTIVREIYRDVPSIITRPVYSNTCLDADGVRLLDRATDAANGATGASAPDGGPSRPPSRP